MASYPQLNFASAKPGTQLTPLSGNNYSFPTQIQILNAIKTIPYACTREGGRIRFPDGSILYPGHCVIHPNGRASYPTGDGSMVIDEKGTVLLPDMSMVFADGSRIYPDGHIDQAISPPGSPAGRPRALSGPGMTAIASSLAPGTKMNRAGMMAHADGSTRLPDGSVLLPSGQVVYPDGTHAMELKDGAFRLTDGTLLMPDGSLRFRDGTLQHTDGTYEGPFAGFRNPNEAATILPNGMIQMPDGSVQMPDGSVQLTDGRLMQPDATLAQRMRDGSYNLWDGTVLLADGVIKAKDGTFKYPDGSVKSASGFVLRPAHRPKGLMPDGSIAIPEGSEPLENGSWKFLNGLIWNRDGSIELPDGSVRLPDDRLRRLNLTTGMPDANGAFVLDDGSMLLHDNTLRMPDGEERRTDGSILHPDGTEQLSDGSLRYPDGLMRLVNGNVIFPDYSIQFPNGQVRLPNGASRDGEGTKIMRPPHDPRFLDPRSQVPIVEWTRLPDGSMKLANGMIQFPDGSVKLPEGSIKLVDGRVKLPNNSFSPMLPDDSHRLSDGSYLLPDGHIRYVDGTVRQLDGSLRCRDGSVVTYDGTTYPPGWPAPRLLSPIFTTPKPPMGSIMYADGSYKLPNGMIQRADNSVDLPDGSIRHPNGEVTLPGGQRAEMAHDGSYILSDGTRLLSEGTLMYSDGSMLFPDGSMGLPTGEIHLIDGRILPPGSSLPRVMVPAFANDIGPLPPGQIPELPRGTLRLRDGSYKLPNNMIYHADGRMTLPDGSVKHPDGRVKLPNGTWLLPQMDGTMKLSDGSLLLPDGCLQYPDGSLKYPDGTIRGGLGGPPVAGPIMHDEAPTRAFTPGVPIPGSGGYISATPTPGAIPIPAAHTPIPKPAPPPKKTLKDKLCGCCRKKKKQPMSPAPKVGSSGATVPNSKQLPDGSIGYCNGVVRMPDGSHRCPDGSIVDTSFHVKSPSGAEIPRSPQGDWILTNGTRVTPNLGIKHKNGVVIEKDGGATCPDGSVRMPPPKLNQLKNAISQSVITEERRVFNLTDNTQLLPNLGIRGRDKVITNLDGSRENPSIGAEIAWMDDAGGRENLCVVRQTVPNGPFHRAGVRQNDVCEMWNTTPLTSKQALIGCVENSFPGENVNINVRRDGQSIGPQRVTIGATNQLDSARGFPSSPGYAADTIGYPGATPSYGGATPSYGGGGGGMRPWFGAQIKFVDEVETGKANNLVQIYQVEQGSPADKAGLMNDDIIRTWNGAIIDGEDDWKRSVQSSAIGQRVTLGIIRNRRTMEVLMVVEGTSRDLGGRQRVYTNTVASTAVV